jgi:hypothetical protein
MVTACGAPDSTSVDVAPSPEITHHVASMAELDVGDVLAGKYRVERMIGEGGPARQWLLHAIRHAGAGHRAHERRHLDFGRGKLVLRRHPWPNAVLGIQHRRAARHRCSTERVRSHAHDGLPMILFEATVLSRQNGAPYFRSP